MLRAEKSPDRWFEPLVTFPKSAGDVPDLSVGGGGFQPCDSCLSGESPVGFCLSATLHPDEQACNSRAESRQRFHGTVNSATKCCTGSILPVCFASQSCVFRFWQYGPCQLPHTIGPSNVPLARFVAADQVAELTCFAPHDQPRHLTMARRHATNLLRDVGRSERSQCTRDVEVALCLADHLLAGVMSCPC